MVHWEDIQARLLQNLCWVTVFLCSILINFVLLLISLSKAKQLNYKKVKCLVANLAFCNIILSVGLLIYTFLVDIYYDVDSFQTLIRLNQGIEFSPLWFFAKQVVHSEMVENFGLAQTFILLMMGVDRYLSLFEGYKPSVKKPFWFCALSIVPYFFALLVFDYRIMSTQISENVAHLIRLVALITPLLLSVVFTGCSSIRLVQKQNSGGNNARNEFFFSTSLLLILLLQTVEKFGLFLELLKTNFMFDIVIGEEESDQLLSDILQKYYQIAHLLFLTGPLYMALIIQLGVAYYRQAMLQAGGRLFGCMTKCNKDPKLDYSSETMRSIIAEQTRARQLRTCYCAR